MPPWLATILLTLGKPAFVILLRIIESKYPGAKAFIDAVIAYLRGSSDKPQAIADLHKHCEGLFCPADLKG